MASNGNDPEGTAREVFGVFNKETSLQEAIDELLMFPGGHAEGSLLAGEDTVVENLGKNTRKSWKLKTT